jgi:hypothetical protein
MDRLKIVKDKLQEHIIAENKQINKETKMMGKDNSQKKTLGLRNKIL